MLGSCQTCILLNDFKADMMDRLMLNSPRVGEISFQILLRAFVEACKKNHLQYIRSKNPAVFCDHGGFKKMKLARVLLGFSLYSLNQLEMTKRLKVQHLIHISSWVFPTSLPPWSLTASKSWKHTSGFAAFSHRKWWYRLLVVLKDPKKMVSRLSNKNPRNAQENWKKSEARHLQRFKKNIDSLGESSKTCNVGDLSFPYLKPGIPAILKAGIRIEATNFQPHSVELILTGVCEKSIELTSKSYFWAYLLQYSSEILSRRDICRNLQFHMLDSVW